MEPENPRKQWATSRPEFIFTCFTYVLFTGTVLAPEVFSDTKGGTALVAYLFSLVVLAAPLIFLEMYLGQYSSSGGLAVWRASPLFGGIGIAQALISVYDILQAAGVGVLGIYYFCLSMKDVPYHSTCHNEWNTEQCGDPNTTFYGVFHEFGGIGGTASEEFFTNVLGRYFVGYIVLALCLFWAVVLVITFFGITVIGKVAYVTAILPVLIWIVLLIRGVTLPGAIESLQYHFGASSLKYNTNTARAVVNGAVMAVYVAYPGQAVYSSLASYNRKNYNIFRDVLIIIVYIMITSMLGVITTIAFGGFGSSYSGENLTSYKYSEFLYDPIKRNSVYMSEILMMLPIRKLWAILFYGLQIVMCVGYISVKLESLRTAIVDILPCQFFRRPIIGSLLLLPMIAILWIIGLVYASPWATRFLHRLWDSSFFYLLLLALECVAFALVYNYATAPPRKIYRNLSSMFGRIFDRGFVLDLLLGLVIPVLLVVMQLVIWIRRFPADRSLRYFPIKIIGVVIIRGSVALAVVIWTFIWIILAVIKKKNVIAPTETWPEDSTTKDSTEMTNL